jgi:hypothetical protein
MDKGKRKVSYDVVHVDVIDEEDLFMWEGRT